MAGKSNGQEGFFYTDEQGGGLFFELELNGLS